MQDQNIDITYDIEFNDGCSSQFKCATAFSNFACRLVPTTRVFFETSHGKSKSDSLGGVVKCYATREVNAKEIVICNAKELFTFCSENLVTSKTPEEKTLLNHLFYFIPVRELEEYRSQVSDINYKSKKGKRKIHQIFNNPSKGSGLYDRQFSCLCDSCMSGNFKNCIYLKDSQGCNSFSNCLPSAQKTWL